MASGGVENIGTHPGRRIEIAGFDTLSPDVEGGGVVKGAARVVQDVEPERRGDGKVALRNPVPHPDEHFVKFFDIAKNVNYHVLKP